MMASVVKSTPNWAALPADVPPHIVTLIQRCLEKDRNTRIGDIAVARFLLSDHATLGSASAATTHRVSAPAQTSASRWRAPRWRVVILLVVAAVLINESISDWIRSRGTTNVAPVARLQMSVSPAEQFPGSTSALFRPALTAMALSPDGRTVAFVGMRSGARQLYVRALDVAAAKPLSGTEGAGGPFFSPDGNWIGFWAGNALKKVPAAGGPPATIAQVSGVGWGASWASDGTIFFASGAGISKVSQEGGTPTTVTTADSSKGERHVLPQVLPGGDTLLFTSVTQEDWAEATHYGSVARRQRAARAHHWLLRRSVRRDRSSALHEKRLADGCGFQCALAAGDRHAGRRRWKTSCTA